VEGVLSHQLKQFVIDGNKVVLSISNPDTRVDDAEFEENEVYAIDIVTSTGEGKVGLISLIFFQFDVAPYELLN
jgi:methionine aminopeptidase